MSKSQFLLCYLNQASVRYVCSYIFYNVVKYSLNAVTKNNRLCV